MWRAVKERKKDSRKDAAEKIEYHVASKDDSEENSIPLCKDRNYTCRFNFLCEFCIF